MGSPACAAELQWAEEERDVGGPSLRVRAFVGREIGYAKGVLLI